jgi:hypothetical protein
LRSVKTKMLLAVGLVLASLPATFPARATPPPRPSTALPTDHVKACLHLNQNQLHVAAASEPVLMAFRVFMASKMVASLNITLVRAFPDNADEPLFVLFPNDSAYKSVTNTGSGTPGGTLRASQYRQSISPTADANQRQFVQTLLSRDLSLVETLHVIEARTSDPPACEIELEASVLAGPADHTTRNYECNAAGCSIIS